MLVITSGELRLEFYLWYAIIGLLQSYFSFDVSSRCYIIDYSLSLSLLADTYPHVDLCAVHSTYFLYSVDDHVQRSASISLACLDSQRCGILFRHVSLCFLQWISECNSVCPGTQVLYFRLTTKDPLSDFGI